MWDIRLFTARAKLLTHAIRKNAKTLVTRDAIAHAHRNVGQELIFCRPAVAVVDLYMAK